MILHALCELARREGLVEDPDYERRRVDFALRVSEDGRFVALVPLLDEHGHALFRDVPRLQTRTKAVVARYFVDTAKYVLGLDAAEKPARIEQCMSAFQARVRDCATATGDPGAEAVLKFLDRLPSQLPRIVKQREEWTGNEVLMFVLESDGDRPVHLRPEVMKHFGEVQRQAEAKRGPMRRCCVTGEMAPIARTHPVIKRVPGPNTKTSGALLVSFNGASFTSHGLSQGDNAPVSEAAAAGYAAGLNYLLSSTQERRFRQGFPLSEDTAVVFWTRERTDVPDRIINLLDHEPVADDVDAMLRSPWEGREFADFDETPFYSMTIAGNVARVVVRDWLATTVVDVRRCLHQYFNDLRIGAFDRAFSIRGILRALETPAGVGPRPDLAGRLFRSALRGEPFPRQLLTLALDRLRLPPARNPSEEWRLLTTRVATIKATLLRLPHGGALRSEISVSLDENSTSGSYVAGRLFAVLEHLQGAALGDVNATIRDRFFATASRTPARVFPALITLSGHHLQKLQKRKPGLAVWFERVQGAIIDMIPSSGFPKFLSPEEQGLFSIGYYHQKDKLFQRRKDASTPEDQGVTGSHDKG